MGTVSRISKEILLVLTITFGMSGVRSLLGLIDDLLSPVPLNEQSQTLYDEASQIGWLDLALQAASAATLIAWGLLALFLLGTSMPKMRWSDLGWGAFLAAIIGIPGLGLYIFALHVGLSKEVIPTTQAVEIPVLLLWSAANAFGEEVVVVMYLMTRLKQLNWPAWAAIGASSILRGSYHLYQGVSAGFGNIIMGIVYSFFYYKTGRIWPLIIAHFLIDSVAFVGYLVLDLSWLGL
ncbi:CPBP family intramembrane glutamic endopeptidase [Corynebacterium sp. S7]